MKEKAKKDYTYCYGMNCKEAEKCWRYVGKYEFDNDYYSFVAGKVGEYKCIEEDNREWAKLK